MLYAQSSLMVSSELRRRQCNNGGPVAIFSLSAVTPHCTTATMLKRQHPTLQAKTQQWQFSTTGRKQCLTHTHTVKKGQMLHGWQTLIIACIFTLQELTAEHIRAVRCTQSEYILQMSFLTHCVLVLPETSLDDALPCWKDCKVASLHL